MARSIFQTLDFIKKGNYTIEDILYLHAVFTQLRDEGKINLDVADRYFAYLNEKQAELENLEVNKEDNWKYHEKKGELVQLNEDDLDTVNRLAAQQPEKLFLGRRDWEWLIQMLADHPDTMPENLKRFTQKCKEIKRLENEDSTDK